MKATSAVSVILLLTSVSSAQVFVEGPLYPHTAPTPPVQVGGSLAADDGLALVSGLEPEAAGYRGVVYCYERTSDGWSLYQRIPSPGIGDWFGGGVEVAGEYAFIGAAGQPGPQGNPAGAVYALERQGPGNEWSVTQVLTAALPATTDLFGSAIDCDGDLLVVTSQPTQTGPRVHVFEREISGWEQTITWHPSGPVRVANGRLLRSTGNVVEVLEKVNDAWTIVDTLESSGPGSHGVIGADGDRVITVHGWPTSLFHVFERSSVEWELVDSFWPSALSPDYSLSLVGSLHGDTFVTKASSTQPPITSSLVVFKPSSAGWARTAFLGSPAVDHLFFAGDFAFSGEELLVSDSNEGFQGNGGVWVYNVPEKVRATAFCTDDVAPCGNPDPFGGCATSFSSAGARILASGTTSMAADDLLIHGRHFRTNSTAFLFLGIGTLSTPLTWSNGLLGLSGRFGRLAPIQVDGEGNFVAGGLAAQSTRLPSALQLGPGIYGLQGVFLDANGLCGGSFGTSNALELEFIP